MSNTLLVTGASGQLGQRVVELLIEAGHGQIIAATRSPEKLARFSDQGVEVRHADFDDTAALPAAFAGADRLLLISTDALSVPGHRLAHQIAAVRAAEAAGVKHVLYTSIQNPVPASPISVVGDHRGTEEALEASNLTWTFLRANLYMDFLMGTIRPALESGVLTSAAGDGRAAHVLREDLARAAAAALALPDSENRALDITGPEALSYGDLAAVASEVFDREIVYKPLTAEEKVQGMVAAGLPEPVARSLITFDVGIAQGFLAETSSAVEDLTGQAPTSFRDYLISQRAEMMPGD